MRELAIEFHHISKIYPNALQPALNDLSFQIYEGNLLQS